MTIPTLQDGCMNSNISITNWPSGINEIPAIVGSVKRAVRHGEGAAGKVSSFLAVKKEEKD